MIRQSNEAGSRKDRLGQEDEDDDDRNGCICSADFGDVRGNDRCVASGSRARKPRSRKPVAVPRVLISPAPISPAPPAGRRDGSCRRKYPGRDIPARIDLQRCGFFLSWNWVPRTEEPAGCQPQLPASLRGRRLLAAAETGVARGMAVMLLPAAGRLLRLAGIASAGAAVPVV